MEGVGSIAHRISQEAARHTFAGLVPGLSWSCHLADTVQRGTVVARCGGNEHGGVHGAAVGIRGTDRLPGPGLPAQRVVFDAVRQVVSVRGAAFLDGLDGTAQAVEVGDRPPGSMRAVRVGVDRSHNEVPARILRPHGGRCPGRKHECGHQGGNQICRFHSSSWF